MHAPDEITGYYRGYDPVTETYHVRHERGGDETLGETIIFAVAALAGKLPTEIERLHDAIDPDALAALFRPVSNGNRRSNGHVSFTLEGHPITVYASGEIAVGVADDERSGTPRRPFVGPVDALVGLQRIAIEGWRRLIDRLLSLQRAFCRWTNVRW